MAYEVHVGVFDGPFELLLALINAQQVDLYEVSLAGIVDGFLAELARLERVDLEVATEFLLIAATLVELKCARLLPGQGEVDLGEDLSLFEARDYLLARLLECRTFSSAAGALAELEARAEQSVPRRAGPDERFEVFAPQLLRGVRPEDLAAALRRALVARPVDEVLDTHVLVDEVSVAEAIEELRGLLPVEGRTTFAELTSTSASKAHLVACFLALLELYKQGLVEIEQACCFGPLSVWLATSPLAPQDAEVSPARGQAPGATREVSEDAPQDTPQDISEDVPQDTPQDISEDASRDAVATASGTARSAGTLGAQR